MVLLFFSGCLENVVYPTPESMAGKYVLDNSSVDDTITLETDNSFYAVEYMKYTRKNAEFYGTYTIKNNELILKYEFIGLVRRFEISNNTRTLIDRTNGNMTYNRVIT